MVSLLCIISTGLGARVALLEDIVVTARGVGKQLLHASLASARKRGIAGITLLTDARNTAAQRFY